MNRSAINKQHRFIFATQISFGSTRLLARSYATEQEPLVNIELRAFAGIKLVRWGKKRLETCCYNNKVLRNDQGFRSSGEVTRLTSYKYCNRLICSHNYKKNLDFFIRKDEQRLPL